MYCNINQENRCCIKPKGQKSRTKKKSGYRRLAFKTLSALPFKEKVPGRL